MKKHIFLTGPDSSACSRVLTEVLGPALALAGGLMLHRESTPSGLTVSLLPAAAAGGVEGFTPGLFIDLSGSVPKKDNELIRTEAVRLLEEAQYYPFAVLDCIGGIDLMIPQYRSALQTLLSSELPLIGTLVSAEENRRLKEAFSISDRYDILTAHLPEVLKADTDSTVLDLSTLGETTVLRLCRQWTNEYVFS